MRQGEYIQIKNSKNNIRNFTLEHYRRFGFRLTRDVEVSSLKIRFHFQDNPRLDFLYRSKRKSTLSTDKSSSGILTKENMKNRKKYKSPMTIMDDKIPIIVNRGHHASLDAYGNIIIEKK